MCDSDACTFKRTSMVVNKHMYLQIPVEVAERITTLEKERNRLRELARAVRDKTQAWRLSAIEGRADVPERHVAMLEAINALAAALDQSLEPRGRA